MKFFSSIIRLIRVKQWAKNVLIFVPAVIDVSVVNISNLIDLVVTFFLFSFSASLIYVVNDWLDRELDAKHPTKCSRPFATGELGLTHCLFVLSALVILLVLFWYFGNDISPYLLVLLSLYVFQSILYSYILKQVTIMEMLIVSSGYSYRVLAGGIAIAAVPSAWILITIFLGSIFIVAQKRLTDLSDLTGEFLKRRAFDEYSVTFLNFVTAVAAGSAIVSYLLFTLSEYAFSKFQNDYLPISSVFVIYAVLRYVQLTLNGRSGNDPVHVITSDRHIIYCALGWGSFIVITNTLFS